MAKVEIEPDFDFAQHLDLNCVCCSLGYTPDNLLQIRTVEERSKAHPNELEVLKRLSQRCKKCFNEGKPAGLAIADTLSCLYRGGIKSPNK